MLKYSKIKALLLIFLFVVFGCTTKKYSFTGVSEINRSESSNPFIDKRFRPCLL